MAIRLGCAGPGASAACTAAAAAPGSTRAGDGNSTEGARFVPIVTKATASLHNEVTSRGAGAAPGTSASAGRPVPGRGGGRARPRGCACPAKGVTLTQGSPSTGGDECPVGAGAVNWTRAAGGACGSSESPRKTGRRRPAPVPAGKGPRRSRDARCPQSRRLRGSRSRGKRHRERCACSTPGRLWPEGAGPGLPLILATAEGNGAFIYNTHRAPPGGRAPVGDSSYVHGGAGRRPPREWPVSGSASR